MKVGILSDTHGNADAAGHLARQLLKRGAKRLFHCGDIGSDAVLEELASECAPFAASVFAVLGNVDLPVSRWRFFPVGVGIKLFGRSGEVVLDGKQIAWLHGDDSHLLNELLESGKFDYLFSGHSHRFHDRKVGKTRWLNPGSAGKGNPKTALLLDLDSDEIQLISL
jgi:putative phosphoesterase